MTLSAEYQAEIERRSKGDRSPITIRCTADLRDAVSRCFHVQNISIDTDGIRAEGYREGYAAGLAGRPAKPIEPEAFAKPKHEDIYAARAKQAEAYRGAQ